MKLNKVIVLLVVVIYALQATISLAKKNSKLHLKALLARKHHKSNSAFLTKNQNHLTEKEFYDFLKETLVNFKNRNSNYGKTDLASTQKATKADSGIV